MSILFDYITGGNIKVAAHRVVDSNNLHNGIYQDVYLDKLLSMMHKALMIRAPKFLDLTDLIMIDYVENYVDIAVLDLFMFAAPASWPVNYVHEDFSKEIEGYLVKKISNYNYIAGNNRNLSREAHEVLTDFIYAIRYDN
jgi:hypothetical protein